MHLRAKAGAFSRAETGVESFRDATSTFLLAIILSKIVINFVLFGSAVIYYVLLVLRTLFIPACGRQVRCY
jgi:hypothetical protein